MKTLKFQNQDFTAVKIINTGTEIIGLDANDKELWCFRGIENTTAFSLAPGDTYDKTPAMVALDETDSGMIRVIDDLVNALVSKGVIALTDLPEAARTKLQQRQTLRTAL